MPVGEGNDGKVGKNGSGERLAVPLTPGPSPRWARGKVTLHLTPSPPLGERVAEATAVAEAG